ncbi:hypothetical protein TWF730_006280 [Orbilia blumenaviensis]|uniref:BTB domain-containing protein n=1 Tax=Orbilia blumenaviensis TaxID=1796055 RepID=A0AAV9VHB9_9PEZI
MSAPKKDPFECLNPFRKLKQGSSDTNNLKSEGSIAGVVSVSTMSASKTPDKTSQPSLSYAAVVAGTKTPRVQQLQSPQQPKPPAGHQPPAPDYTPWTMRKDGEESPLFRKSLIGLHPYSPPSSAIPENLKIPHGLENPATKKEKGPDGLKESTSAKKTEENVGLKDKDSDIMMDDGDKDWEDEEDAERVELSPEILASPIIHLVLDHTDLSGHDEKVTFRVHKALLEQSSFIKDMLGTTTDEILLDSRLKPYAVDAVIQFLYIGEIDLTHKFGTIEDFEESFDKLTNVEWTSCYLGIASCRNAVFEKIEAAYRSFEFGFNHSAAGQRIKMTKWIYGIDENYIEPGGWVHRMRRRVLSGWCRDISSIQTDQKLLESFENIISEFPEFAFELNDFLTERAREEPKMQSRLEAFRRAEKAGNERFERQRALMFPGAVAHRSRLQLPTYQLGKPAHDNPLTSSSSPTYTPNDTNSRPFILSADAPSFVPSGKTSLLDDTLGNKTPDYVPQVDAVTPSKPDREPKLEEPPLRKRASRVTNLKPDH